MNTIDDILAAALTVDAGAVEALRRIAREVYIRVDTDHDGIYLTDCISDTLTCGHGIARHVSEECFAAAVSAAARRPWLPKWQTP